MADDTYNPYDAYYERRATMMKKPSVLEDFAVAGLAIVTTTIGVSGIGGVLYGAYQGAKLVLESIP